MKVKVTESDKNVTHNNEPSFWRGLVCSVVVSLELNSAGVIQMPSVMNS